MDTLNTPEDYRSDDVSPQTSGEVSTSTPSNNKLRIGIISSVALVLFLGVSVSYAMWQRSTTKDNTTEVTQEELMEDTLADQNSRQEDDTRDTLTAATRSATASPAVVRSTSSPVVTAKPTPTPTATPTPTPVPVDVAITAVYLWDYNAMSSILNPTASNTLSIDEKNWTSIPSPISMTFELKTIGNTSQKSVPYRVTANGTVVQSGLIGLVNSSGTISPTFSLPFAPASYTVAIDINQPSEYTEANTSNNSYTFPYTIRADTTPPQISFEILKRADTQQTCVTPRYATDVSTSENDIRFEGKLDGENWYSFTYRPDPSKEPRYERCLTGPAGEYHTFYVKAWDKRGNQMEGVYSFSLYAF